MHGNEDHFLLSAGQKDLLDTCTWGAESGATGEGKTAPLCLQATPNGPL